MYPNIYINEVDTATEHHIKGFSDYRNVALVKVMFNLKTLNNEIIRKRINTRST